MLEESVVDFGNKMLEAEMFEDIMMEKKKETQYLSKENLIYEGIDVKLSDIFITRPKKDKKTEGTGYMMNKLKNLESPYIQQLFFKYDVESTTINMSIQNYKKNLTRAIEFISDINNNEDNTQTYGLIYLYKLLCKTFIKYKSKEEDIKTFRVKDRAIILCLIYENDFEPNKFNLLLNKNLIIDKTMINDVEYLVIKCNDIIFEKHFQEDINLGVETHYIIHISKEIDEYIQNHFIRKARKQNKTSLEELLE